MITNLPCCNALARERSKHPMRTTFIWSRWGSKKLGGDEEKEYDDASVPVDLRARSWLNGDTLHRGLVSNIHPNTGLIVVCDCYHSGSAIESRYVYRLGSSSNVNLVDGIQGWYQSPGSRLHTRHSQHR